MMKTKLFLFCCGIAVALFTGCKDEPKPNDDPNTIRVETAGTLPTLIEEGKKYETTTLKLIGDLNGTDIRYIREMAGCDLEGGATAGKLSVLDLSEANIVEGGDSYSIDFGMEGGISYAETSNNSIGRYMFYNCASLTSIKLPNSATIIEGGVFEGCEKLTSATIGNSVAIIEDYAFDFCTGITSITIPKNVATIEENAFIRCDNLKEYIVVSDNNSFASIDGVLFNKEKTELVLYPPGKAGTNYTIPNGVRSINREAFFYCIGLTSVIIGNSVTYIGPYAFESCDKLISVTLGDNVAEIGSDAFGGCYALREVYSTNPTPPTCSTSPFSSSSIGNCTLSVPSGSAEAYKATYAWHSFGEIVEMIIN